MPGDHPLVAEHRVEVARLVDPLGELLERRRRPGLGAERGDHLVASDLGRAQQLRPGALLGAELAQAQLASVGEPDQHPRGAVAKRGALVEHLQAAGRHQVDEQGQRLRGAGRPSGAAGSKSTTGILPIRRTPEIRRPRGRRAAGRRSSAPPSRAPAPTRPRRPPSAALKPPRGDLDLGQLGHEPKRREARRLDLWQFIRLVRGWPSEQPGRRT